MIRGRHRVRLADAAKADVRAIVLWIAHDSPRTARSVAGRLHRRIAELQTHPLRGRQVAELVNAGVAGYREIIERPWRVIYRVGGGEVYVVAVFDSRRLLEDVLLQRLVRD